MGVAVAGKFPQPLYASHLNPDIEAFVRYVGFVPIADISQNGTLRR